MSNIDLSKLVTAEQKLGTERVALVASVKAEAERRILAIMPEHRQRNFLAQFAETVMFRGPDPSKWPTDVQALNSAVMSQWGEIKRLRVRSNEIEMMDPIPADFRDDSYWS